MISPATPCRAWFRTYSIVIMAASLLPLIISPLYAGPAYHLHTGSRASLSSGLYDTTVYARPYGRGEMEWGMGRFSLTGGGLINYPVQDGDGGQRGVNLFSGGVSAGLGRFHGLSAGIQYEGCGGEADYVRHDGTLFVNWLSRYFTLGGELSAGTGSYTISGERQDMTSFSWTVEGEYFLSEKSSCDVSFSSMKGDSDSMDLDYRRDIFRAGLTGGGDRVILMAGASFGRDSNDYRLYGWDLAVNGRVTDHVTLMAMYIFFYNSGGGVVVPGILGSGFGAKLKDGSYLSHRLVAGFDYKFF